MTIKLTRRKAIGSAVVGLAGLTAGVARAQDAGGGSPPAAALPTANVGVYHTKVGEIDVALVNDGWFNFDPIHPSLGGNVDPKQVADVIREHHAPPDGRAHIQVLLVRHGDRVALIDAGSGHTFGPTAGRLITNLRTLGIEPEHVTDILVTHAHLDHVGGLTTPDGVVAFPNAAVHVTDAERKFWASNPTLEESGVPEEMKQAVIKIANDTMSAVADRVQSVTPGREVLPGVTAVEAAGHTPGHVVYRIADGDESLLFVGDLIFFPPLTTMNPDWYVAFDSDRAAAAATRFRLMDMIATDRQRICGSHLPFPAFGHLRAAGGGFDYLPEIWRFEV
ncbi:MAG: MBL fold metallo-hydrolase [Planctomycetota bacterium]